MYSPVCLFYISLLAQFNSLLSEGFKRGDIAAAIRELKIFRRSMEHSNYNRSWDNFREKLGETSRSLKKSGRLGGKFKVLDVESTDLECKGRLVLR